MVQIAGSWSIEPGQVFVQTAKAAFSPPHFPLTRFSHLPVFLFNFVHSLRKPELIFEDQDTLRDPQREKKHSDLVLGKSCADSKMAYVDHAFSISDEDIMMEPSYVVNNKPPIKEIGLAVALLFFGTLGIIIGSIMAYNHVGGDTAHGLFFAILGTILFIPGFYYTRIAYFAYKGYKGFSFSNIPPV